MKDLTVSALLCNPCTWKTSSSQVTGKILSSSQIVGFIDHQYPQKECTDSLDLKIYMKISHEDIHQEKVAFETYQSCPNLPRHAKGVPLGIPGGTGRCKVMQD